jgi:hypothetical protein
MAGENVEAVRLAYDIAYAQRSVENVREAFAEDFVFHMRAEWPGRSLYRIDEMPQLWADLDETYAEFRLVPEEFFPAGECVIVTIKQSARLRGSDARVDSTIFHVWQIREGKPQQAWAYRSRSEALEAVGLRE